MYTPGYTFSWCIMVMLKLFRLKSGFSIKVVFFSLYLQNHTFNILHLIHAIWLLIQCHCPQRCIKLNIHLLFSLHLALDQGEHPDIILHYKTSRYSCEEAKSFLSQTDRPSSKFWVYLFFSPIYNPGHPQKVSVRGASQPSTTSAGSSSAMDSFHMFMENNF